LSYLTNEHYSFINYIFYYFIKMLLTEYKMYSVNELMKSN